MAPNPPVVVQKYGGTSLASSSKIKAVARRIIDTAKTGKRMVVVVSAMGDTTDNLFNLAREITPEPGPRELDMLLSVGERISMTLLSMALQELSFQAISFTGSQSGIITSGSHSRAKIIEVRPVRVIQELARGKIVIIAGYQGVSKDKEITTLGRGGSDTTAIAMAAALKAEYCEICSDIDGVYSADPMVVENASKLDNISYQEMQELAVSGAKILCDTAVEFAKSHLITVYSTASTSRCPSEGTKISEHKNGNGRVTGVTYEYDLAYFVMHCQDTQGTFSLLLAFLDQEGVEVKQINFQQNSNCGSIVIPLKNLPEFNSLEKRLQNEFGPGLKIIKGLGAVSLVGIGINNTNQNLLQAFKLIEQGGGEIVSISTSSFRISFLLKYMPLEPLVNTLHKTFCRVGYSKRCISNVADGSVSQK